MSVVTAGSSSVSSVTLPVGTITPSVTHSCAQSRLDRWFVGSMDVFSFRACFCLTLGQVVRPVAPRALLLSSIVLQNCRLSTCHTSAWACETRRALPSSSSQSIMAWTPSVVGGAPCFRSPLRVIVVLLHPGLLAACLSTTMTRQHCQCCGC